MKQQVGSEEHRNAGRLLSFKRISCSVAFLLLINMTADPAQLTNLAQLASSGIFGFKEGLKKVALPLQNAGLSVVVLGFKEVVNKIVFNCPQRHYQLYSLMFMFAPAVLLLCLALMVSRNFWKMAAGCCRLRRPQRRVVWQQSRKYVILSIVPPTAWILFALFDAEYYICAKLGSEKIRLNSTAPFQQSALLAEYESAKIESRMIGIFLLTGIVLVGTVLISIERCCTRPDTRISNDEEYTYFLAEEQIKLFNSKLEPLAKEQAKVEVEALFERFKDVDDIAKKVRLISEELENEIPWAATHEA